MLENLVPKLLCPACLTQDDTLVLHTFSADGNGRIQDGILLCEYCSAWYPIHDHLLELVTPPLLNPQDIAQFTQAFSARLEKLKLKPLLSSVLPDSSNFLPQLQQRNFFDHFAENDHLNYSSYHHSPFWQAVDRKILPLWKSRIPPGSWVLDVGCADGRSSFPLAGRDRTLVGFDISKKLIRKAMHHAGACDLQDVTTFFVADASRIPFRDQSIDFAVLYGVFHHLPTPQETCRQIVGILKPGGGYFSLENNTSLFRGLFDFLMKLSPLWREEAGNHPLISKEFVRQWHQNLPVDVRCRTTVFVPPHLCNALGSKISNALLSLTNALCGSIPGLKHQGGLILIEAVKRKALPSSAAERESPERFALTASHVS